MIKVTTSEPYTVILVPLSKIISIVEHESRVHLSVTGLSEAAVVTESLDEIQSQIDEILASRKNF